MGGRSGRRYSAREPAMLHGAIVWLTSVPILIGLAAFGMSGQTGGWYGGLSRVPVWAAAVSPVDPALAKAIRNTALATAVALLIGLVGFRARGLDGLGRTHDVDLLPSSGSDDPPR